MAEIVVLLSPLDVSRRRRCQIEDDVALLDWVDVHEPAEGRLTRAVFVNGHLCTNRLYRTHPHDEILVAFTPGTLPAVAYYVAQAIVAYAVGAFLQQIFGAKKPSAADMPAPSQVYGIAPPQNAARLGQPIPVIYGTVIALPDFAAQPYTYYDQNDQWLHALLCLGQGDHVVSEMLFANTSGVPLGADVVQWRAFLPADHGGRFGVVQGQTGVRENVVTSPAVGTQELLGQKEGGQWVPSTWYWSLSNLSTSGSPSGVNLTTATMPDAKLALLPASPSIGATVACTVSYNGAGVYTLGTYTATAYTAGQTVAPTALIPNPVFSTAVGNRWVGPFETCKPGQTGTSIEMDFTNPRGLYGTDGSGNIATASVIISVVYEKIDNAGNVIAGGGTFNVTLSGSSTTPQRRTVVQAVASGRYRVKMATQTNGNFTGTAPVALQTIWSGLKFQLDPPANLAAYGNVTLISVRLKATNGVASSAASSMRFRVTRKLAPLGSGATVATVNPADAFVDVMTATYGGGRPVNTDELDLADLTASRSAWAALNGFNAVFDQPSTVWEALSLSVQTVHAAPLPVGSRMSLIHDQPQPVRSQLFTDANIVSGSLAHTAQFDQTGTPAGIRVNYRDPITFSPVALLVPPSAPDFTTIDLFGCTSLTVAQDHAALASNKRGMQRSLVSFETELEGLNVLPGDRIGVSSAMVKWAQSARVEKVVGLTLTLSVALVWTGAGPWGAVLRDSNGVPTRFTPVTQGASAYELVLPSAPSFPIVGANDTQEATIVSFGLMDAETTDWTVSKITPNGDTVAIEALNYDVRIWAQSP